MSFGGGGDMYEIAAAYAFHLSQRFGRLSPFEGGEKTVNHTERREGGTYSV